MDDLISRQAALEMLNDNELERQADDVFDGDLHRYKRAAQRIIAQLPSAVKHGRWETEVRTIHGHKIPFFACSVCGKNADDEYRYCPNCGAKMERSEE